MKKVHGFVVDKNLKGLKTEKIENLVLKLHKLEKFFKKR